MNAEESNRLLRKVTKLFETDSQYNCFSPTGEWTRLYDEIREEMGYKRLFNMDDDRRVGQIP